MAELDKKEDSWVGIYWRPAAAVVYLFICLFDFVLVPSLIGFNSEHLYEIVAAVKDLPSDSQNIVLSLKLAQWEPLTLKGGGLFHIAFGAILGVAAWSRGKERVIELESPTDYRGGSRRRRNYYEPEGDDEPDDYSSRMNQKYNLDNPDG